MTLVNTAKQEINVFLNKFYSMLSYSCSSCCAMYSEITVICIFSVAHLVYEILTSCFSPQCVVIGLQSTGEARTLEALEEGGGELNDFVSTAKYGLT